MMSSLITELENVIDLADFSAINSPGFPKLCNALSSLKYTTV